MNFKQALDTFWQSHFISLVLFLHSLKPPQTRPPSPDDSSSRLTEQAKPPECNTRRRPPARLCPPHACPAFLSSATEELCEAVLPLCPRSCLLSPAQVHCSRNLLLSPDCIFSYDAIINTCWYFSHPNIRSIFRTRYVSNLTARLLKHCLHCRHSSPPLPS